VFFILEKNRERNEVRLFYIYLLLFIIYLAVRKSIVTLSVSVFMGVQMSVYGCTNVSLWVYKCQFMGVQMSVYKE